MCLSKPVWEMLVKSKCLVDELAHVLQQRKVNVCMDMLCCVGYVGGKKTSVWMVWSAQATAEKRKCLLGQVSLCELLQ